MLEILKDCPWQVQANAFMSCLAKAAHLATLTGDSDINSEAKQENVRRENLCQKKREIFFKIRELRRRLKKKYQEDRILHIKKKYNSDIVVLQLETAEKDRRELNVELRKIERNLVMRKEKQRLDTLNANLEKCNSRDFYKVLKSYQGRILDDFPDSLLVEGKLYTGDQVLNGFKEMAFLQSRKEKMFTDNIPREYTRMKEFNILYEKIVRNDGCEIKRLPNQDILAMVNKIKNGKSPDLTNCGKENIVNGGGYIKEIFCNFVNDMLTDPNKYSASLASTSVASFLYKGKEKDRLDPTSYRKISIGSFYNKIVDKLFAEETQAVAKENQPPLQYGFTSGVNFLLCSVLRESVIRKAKKDGKAPIMLACDVKNAFSKTSRTCQMYELYNAGERSKVWLYSKHTYENTWTVVKKGSNYSDMVEEMCGSKQGGVKSAVDYKSYNSPLYKLIKWSGLRLKIAGKRYGSIIVADDALSITNTIAEMKGIIQLYAYFASLYSVEYCVKKTIINVFGKKDDKDRLINSDLKIGGVTPLYDESSIHLGLWLSEDLERVAEINIDHRLKKTDNKLFGSLRNVIWDKTGLSTLETKIKLYTSLLRPSLLSGMNALCIRGVQLQRLKEWEEWLLRKIFGLKENSSTCGIYAHTNLLPIEGHLHKSVLSIFYNAWQNKMNPVVEIIKLTSNEKDVNGFWAAHLKTICEKYRLPDPIKMLESDCPTKESWKKLVNSKILEFYSRELTEKRSTMRTLELSHGEINLRERLTPSLSSRFKSSNAVIKTVNEMLVGEYKNQDWMIRNLKDGKSNLREDEMCDIIPVHNARHMSRLPSALIWKLDETADLFMKLSMLRPNLKSIEFEPIGRRAQTEYEKELVQIENHVLGGDDEEEMINDALMEGNNVDAEGKPIVFKLKKSVRNKKDGRISGRVIKVDVDDLRGLAKYQGDMRKNAQIFKTFEFSGNSGTKDLKSDAKSKIPAGRKVEHVEYIEEETVEVKLDFSDKAESNEDGNRMYVEKIEPSLITPTRGLSSRNAVKWKRDQSSSDSDDEDDVTEDFSNPDIAINLIEKVKDAKGTVTAEFQKSLKRLKKFNERKMDRHARKKLKQAATLMMTPTRRKTTKHLMPRSLDVTAEALLKETPTKEKECDEEKKETMNIDDDHKKNDLDNILDDMEEKLGEKKMSNNERLSKEDTTKNKFSFNPDISFPNATEGNIWINISKCPTDSLVTCGREYPGLEPTRDGHCAFAFTTITMSESAFNLKNLENLYMAHICNLFLFFYRMNQYQAVRTGNLRRCLTTTF